MDEKARSGSGESVVAQIAARLRDDIACARLAPGQRLVEIELVREFGVSRGPLRQALGQLMAEGVVVSERHRGVSVRPMTRDDVRHLYQVREALEGEAAALAAARSGEPAVRRACEDMLRDLRTYDTADYTTELRDHDRFHEAVTEAAGNPVLTALIRQLRPLIFRAQFRGRLSDARARLSIHEHERIFTAVLSGEPEVARDEMRSHIRASRDTVLSLPDEAFR
ncbi:GntR family transcriptional regulator [Actinomadura sp. NPDC047616]|uniref:GntR family transcriptional regulator n=1 Tax=Actinomadura sp. NPDC047616 TaxID=3155914 RepID=UPI0033E7BA65